MVLLEEIFVDRAASSAERTAGRAATTRMVGGASDVDTVDGEPGAGEPTTGVAAAGPAGTAIRSAAIVTSGQPLPALAVRACFNCHSNETRWPWYANLAPFSWIVQFDVEAPRSVTNFSEWNRAFELAPYAGQSVWTGSLPTLKYQMAHPEANLTGQEMLDLARGLDATLGTPREPRS